MDIVSAAVKVSADFIDENTKKVENCIVPIFFAVKGARPEFHGTSVYLSLDGRYFLATAQHVACEGAMDKVIPMTNDTFDSIPTDKFMFERDKNVDIAIAELTKPLELFTPIQLENIYNIDHGKGIPCSLIAMGFPGSKVKSSIAEAHGLLKKFATNESSDAEYIRLGVDKRIGIVIDFDKKNVISPSKGIVEFPKPNGMSGGGLFWMHKSGISEKDKPVLLIGILTEWDPVTQKGMIAMKINYALAMVKGKYGVNIPDAFVNGIKIIE